MLKNDIRPVSPYGVDRAFDDEPFSPLHVDFDEIDLHFPWNDGIEPLGRNRDFLPRFILFQKFALVETAQRRRIGNT